MKLRFKIMLGVAFTLATSVGFRGPIFNKLVTYEVEKPRKLKKLTSEKGGKMIMSALQVTDKLSFTSEKASSEPDAVLENGVAHCVGYAQLFAALVDGKQWEATPVVGKIRVVGFDVHSLFGDDPFFKDHDFVVLKHKKRNETIAIDPTLNDYFGISEVTLR